MVSIKKIFLLLIVCLYATLCAQGENDNWYFGQFAALNFSNPIPTFINNSQMGAFEACGTVSDSNGKLLFYCNPQAIINREHQAMQNGTGIQSTDTSQQLAIVKNPANVNQYFVFNTGENTTGLQNNNRIIYSIVDMSLGPIGADGLPLGAVTNAKNIPVLDNTGNIFYSEAITVVKGATFNTYWVLIPNGNSLYSYKVDNQGFANGNPVVSILNFPVNLGQGRYYSIKASPFVNNPNFTNYICISHWSYTNMNTGATTYPGINRVMGFNAATGTLDNSFGMNINGIQSYMPEFNQNGSVLFLSYKNVHAVDLLNSTTGNVISSQIYGDSTPNTFGKGMQRNKYGDIFLSSYNSNFLGRINNPNTYSNNLSVTMNAVQLANRYASYGLPQLVPYFEKQTYYPCINDLVLDTPETNNNFVYNVGNIILTEANYSVTNDKQIIMNAGKSITFKPNTHIVAKSFLARIVPCNRNTTSIQEVNRNLKLKQTDMVLNLDLEEKEILENNINIYPNPSSDFINIDSRKEKILSWELFDISGRSILKGNSSKVNVQSLPKANYILNINTVNKQITKKVTVK